LNGENKKIIFENSRNLESKAQKPSIKVHNETFFEYQKQMDDAEQRKISFGNKTLEEAEIRGLEGNEEKGKIIFEEIERKYRHEHNDYYLFSPYNKQQQNPDKMEVDNSSHGGNTSVNNTFSSQHLQK